MPFRAAVLGPSLSKLRCRCDPIPLHSTVSGRFLSLRSAVLRRDHPSPVCGAGAIPLHSAVSVRSHPSPLYGIGMFPSLSVRRYQGETIPLRSTVLGPSLSTLRCRCDPIPLRSTVSGRFHPSPFGGTRARSSLSGLRCWGHPSPRCGVGAIPSLSALRYRDVSNLFV